MEWANENHERMERINEDTAYNDFQIALTAEELSFVKMTVFLSGMENGKAVQGIYTETQPILALVNIFRKRPPAKSVRRHGAAYIINFLTIFQMRKRLQSVNVTVKLKV